MRADVSWRGPAKRYAALYRSLVAGRGRMSSSPTPARPDAHAGRRSKSASFPRMRAQVYVCLYDESGDARNRSASPLTPDGSARIRGAIPGLRAGARYGLRVDGPFDPAQRASLRRLQSADRSLCGRVRSALPTASANCSHLAPTPARSFPKAIATAPPSGEPGPRARRLAPHDPLRAEPARLQQVARRHPRGRARALRRRSPSRR